MTQSPVPNAPEQEPEKQQENEAEKASAAGTPSTTEVESLQKRIAELEAKLKEQESKYLYLYAEFENYRKRTFKERADLLKFGWEPVAHELLQIIDNLERALQHMPENTDKSLRDGIQMVLNQFKATLEKQGVQGIDTNHKNFDPNFHEAIAQESSEQPPGVIVKEHLRGYTLHGRLLRPSRVVVSSGTKESNS